MFRHTPQDATPLKRHQVSAQYQLPKSFFLHMATFKRFKKKIFQNFSSIYVTQLVPFHPLQWFSLYTNPIAFFKKKFKSTFHKLQVRFFMYERFKEK